MNNRPLAISDPEGICFKCLKKKDVNRYSLHRSEYGSSFDNNYTYLQLCDDCKPTGLEDWFNEEPEEIDYYANYKYEKNILEFIETLPLEGQELFWARCSYGACSDDIVGQDWIDYELGILPHEKCKEYGVYSPEERKAYDERFPVCDKVKIVEYDDVSRGARCPFGAFGNKDGSAEGHQTQAQCYECKLFNTRNGEIEAMDSEDFEIYTLQSELALRMLKKELKKKK